MIRPLGLFDLLRNRAIDPSDIYSRCKITRRGENKFNLPDKTLQQRESAECLSRDRRASQLIFAALLMSNLKQIITCFAGFYWPNEAQRRYRALVCYTCVTSRLACTQGVYEVILRVFFRSLESC
jgi:hypothetical protein